MNTFSCISTKNPTVYLLLYASRVMSTIFHSNGQNGPVRLPFYVETNTRIGQLSTSVQRERFQKWKKQNALLKNATFLVAKKNYSDINPYNNPINFHQPILGASKPRINKSGLVFFSYVNSYSWSFTRHFDGTEIRILFVRIRSLFVRIPFIDRTTTT